MSERPALIASGLVKAYGRESIVDGVNIELAPDTITALLGPSGAGKSTVLRLLAGLEPVDEGEVRIGADILSRRGFTLAPEHRRTGLIFQDFALFPHMSAQDNVAFGLSRLPKPERRERAFHWLDRLGLAARASAYPHQLSGGEQQRVAIARALAPEPRAMLMDEPFSGLDPQLRDSVADMTIDAVRAAGVPTLIVSHDAPASMQRADRLVIMRKGRIVQAGTPGEVYDRPADIDIAASLGAINRLKAVDLPEGLRPEGLSPQAELALREEAVILAPHAPVGLEVIGAARVGAAAHVRFALADGKELHALLNTRELPARGARLHVAIDPAGCHVFMSARDGAT